MRLYVIIILMLATSALFFFMPSEIEQSNHYLHFLAIVVSGRHIAEELVEAYATYRVG